MTDVRLDDNGVVADLALKSGIPIPGDLTAEVHSASSIGEQYVALLPHGGRKSAEGRRCHPEGSHLGPS